MTEDKGKDTDQVGAEPGPEGEAKSGPPGDPNDSVGPKAFTDEPAGPEPAEELPGQKTDAETEEVKSVSDENGRLGDGFQPFFEKEARTETRRKRTTSVLLYLLLAVLAAGLLGLGLEAFFETVPLAIEAATTVVICFALIGILWKTISLETKVGLEAAALGVVIALVYAVYGRNDLGMWGLPGGLVLPVFFCLVVTAALWATWLLWPRISWLPMVLTVLFLYSGLAPLLSLAGGGSDLKGIMLQPTFMHGWLAYIGSGYLLSQVFLPLGILLFLILQARTLFRARYRTHWGFLFWALCLALASAAGLIGLKQAERPVFPNPVRLAAWINPPPPVSTPARPQAAPEPEKTQPLAIAKRTRPPEETAAPSPQAVERPSAGEPGSTPSLEDRPGTSPKADLPAADIKEETLPEKAAEEAGPVTSPERPAIKEEALPEKEAPAAGPEPAATGPDRAEVDELKKRVKSLEAEILELKKRIEAQDRLIRSLMGYLGSKPGTGPAPPGTPTPPGQTRKPAPKDEGPGLTPPKQRPPEVYQDYT